MKNFGEILNFCANYFINFFKNFQKSLISRFVLNVFSQPKFWSRHCSTGLERNSFMKFFLMFPSPNQNSGAAPVYSIYTVYLCCHLCPPPKLLYVADPMVYWNILSLEYYYLLEILAFLFCDHCFFSILLCVLIVHSKLSFSVFLV